MKELTVLAAIENLPVVTEFVDAKLEQAGCPLKTQFQIDVVIDEIFSNICHYAYFQESGEATIQVDVGEDDRTVTITFLDSGKPFDPLSGDDPDISLELDDRTTGGLGIFLVKKTMDTVDYEYRNGQNILRIRKKM